MVMDLDEITIVNVPVQKVLGITKTGSYQMIPYLLIQFMGYMISGKITMAGPRVFICHETSPESVKEAAEKGTAVVEVAWPVAGIVQGSQEIRAYELPGGKMVHTIHRDRTRNVSRHISGFLPGSQKTAWPLTGRYGKCTQTIRVKYYPKRSSRFMCRSREPGASGVTITKTGWIV